MEEHTIKSGIEIPQILKARVKSAAALRGLKFKEATVAAFTTWLAVIEGESAERGGLHRADVWLRAPADLAPIVALAKLLASDDRADQDSKALVLLALKPYMQQKTPTKGKKTVRAG